MLPTLIKDDCIFVGIDDDDTQFFINPDTISSNCDNTSITVLSVPDDKGKTYLEIQEFLKEEEKDFTALRYVEQLWGLDLLQGKYAIYGFIFKSEDGSVIHSVSFSTETLIWKHLSADKIADKISLRVSHNLEKKQDVKRMEQFAVSKKTTLQSKTKKVVRVDKENTSKKDINIKIVPKSARSVSVIKKELETTHIPMYQMMMGATWSESKRFFDKFFKAAKEQALKEGTIELPENYGDILFEMERHDNALKAIRDMKRKEGVKDEDFRWWGNMHELERGMMIQEDIFFRFAYYSNLIKNYNFSVDDALKELQQSHPMFGNPDTVSNASGDDRLLPYELKNRINIYIEKLSKISQREVENMQNKIRKFSSFNAFIRNEIRKGNI